MEMLNEKSSKNDMCELCNKQSRKYTCPRCGIGYCNRDCYKSNAHLECSESFYKQCVEEELKSQEPDPEARKTMVAILKRAHEEQIEDILGTSDESDEEGTQLDSDDEEEVPDLEKRLKDVNLDNADEIWSALTNSEKQEFQALIKNGEVEKILPEWHPWWSIQGTRRLVEDADSNELPEYMKYCPTLVEVPVFSELQKASPNLRYNIINVIYSYAYMALYYNGDYLNCAEEATKVFLVLCNTIRCNEVFENVESAVVSVTENIIETDWLPKDEQMMLIFREAGNMILQGPEERAKSLYSSAAVSELHRVFNTARAEISAHKNNSREFSSRFSHCSGSNLNLSKKTLLLYCKKLEYYLSWLKSSNCVN